MPQYLRRYFSLYADACHYVFRRFVSRLPAAEDMMPLRYACYASVYAPLIAYAMLAEPFSLMLYIIFMLIFAVFILRYAR